MNLKQKFKKIEREGVQKKYLNLAGDHIERLKKEFSEIRYSVKINEHKKRCNEFEEKLVNFDKSVADQHRKNFYNLERDILDKENILTETHLSKEFYGSILQVFGDNLGKYSFLDIGCGSNEYMPLLSAALYEKGVKVTGVDLYDMHKEVIERWPFDFLKKDFSSPSFHREPKKVDVVIVNSILEGGWWYPSAGNHTVDSYFGLKKELEIYSYFLNNLKEDNLNNPIFMVDVGSKLFGLKGKDLENKINSLISYFGGEEIFCGSIKNSFPLDKSKIVYR